MGLYVYSYLCFLIFLIGAGVRIYQQTKMPLHLRWELYPVQHEDGERPRYGGSYMEEPDWWKKEKSRSLWNEIQYMVPEILFLRGLWEENRKLWRISFPFHFGLYLVLATFGLLVLGALTMALGGSIGPGGSLWSSGIHYLTILFGFLGLTLGTVGTFGLLLRRMRDPELKGYSSPGDFLNLFLILFFLAVGLITWLFYDPSFEGARAYLFGLLTMGGKPMGYAGEQTVLGWLTIVSGSFLLAYIPLTHMAHMFMKYFMYHKIRWEDAPNIKGSKIEAAVLANLGYRPTWSAPHIGADGEKTWADLALSMPKEKK